MFLIGLTGGIATGKSTVSDMMREMGIPIIDVDIIARQVVEPGRRAWRSIQTAFGDEVFLDSGEIDREKLGKLIFSDIKKRRTINKITHPEIYKEVQWQVLRYLVKGEQFVVLDLPLLYESNKCLSYLYKTIVVACDDEIQLERLMSRNNYTEKEAIARIEAQMPLDRKCRLADFVIENSGSQGSTREQVDGIVKYLKASKHHLYLRALWSGGIGLILAVFVWLLVLYLS